MQSGNSSVIYDLLQRNAECRPDAEAAVDGATRLTHAQVFSAVRQRAKALLAAGIARGDRVATMSPPSLAFWLDYLAVTAIGAIWQGLNPRYQKPEYQYLLHDAQPKLVFITSPYEARDYSEDLQAVGPATTRYVVRGTPTGNAVAEMDFLQGAASVSDAALDAAIQAVEPEDIAVIVYTSGTTGKPKGAMLSHRAIVASARTNAAYFGAGLESSICAAPINHVGGLNNLCMSVLAHSGRIIFYHKVDLQALAALTRSEQPSYLVASPTTFVMLQQSATTDDLTRMGHIRLLVFGGAKTPAALLEPVAPHVGKMYNVYGQTETSGVATATRHGASIEEMAETIGQALPGMEMRVARTDDSECDVDENGEIQLRGPICASGYWNNPEASQELFTRDGFLRTGDLGRRRADGNVCFVGRLKEMYKSGGYNIYPVELEQNLCEHPDVIEAAVLPVPNELFQEVGYAFVVPRAEASLTAADLDSWLRPRLANYKIPKYWSLVTELPRLPNTKVDKQALKRRLENFPEEFYGDAHE